MQNLIFSTNSLFNALSWRIPTEFNFTGYDPSLFFNDHNDAVYLTEATVSGTAIALATIDIETGVLGDLSYPWNGIGLGTAEGPHLCKKDDYLPGIDDGLDVVDFALDSVLPSHWVHIRYYPNDTIAKDITFVGRRQIETLFSFSVDLNFDPQWLGERAGNSVYLDEKRHIDFSVANEDATVPQPVASALSPEYRNRTPIRLEVAASNTAHFTFPAGFPDLRNQEAIDMKTIGHAGASPVNGRYQGVVVGVNGTTSVQTIEQYQQHTPFVFVPVNEQSVELRREAPTLHLED
ncbi:beta-xylosidase [Colletotrichum fioriniae PJ7]|uniref:Beta-xylosidase n=1 Tax=Colletotrichum fioriniae PJ7 TaxID=1445577 RepID=A0A010PZL5_9PEZI|nr:beta-xylosidase [Colletotrichum fioriniae PJ7]